ncbi:MAG: 1-acyl-sn-glycerol-3-phosphate acyltransferase [Tissierellales bacterium]|nr:1-acyl-sn-glycerol-3-phosphate acyltransferase [Tissierellales bacterium]MBN2828450.1 1-acyl-sn-glycerol-3-phosphate acyltransferase [Tissierellales bacterium]
MFYTIVCSLTYILLHLLFRIKVHAQDDLRNHDEPLIVCSNHSSMLDPFLVAITFKDKISYMGKKELFEKPILKFLLSNVGVFPVDRKGNPLNAIKNSIRILNENRTLGIFPEGTRVKEFDLNMAKAGTGMLVVKSKATVLPLYIEPGFKLFGPINIYYGERYNYNNMKEKFSSEDYVEISKDIMTRVYSLKNIFEGNSHGNH